MKIRNGFVSNSSSSSFICDVCGHVESGWDMSMSEMYECTNGHTFCESHVSDNVDNKSLLIAYYTADIECNGDKYGSSSKLDEIVSYAGSPFCCGVEVDSDFCPECGKSKNEFEYKIDPDYYSNLIDDIDIRYEYPSEYCPICSFGSIDDGLLIQYLIYSKDLDIQKLKGEIKDKFKNYDEYVEFIKNKRKDEN